jgi:hypothetical protein
MAETSQAKPIEDVRDISAITYGFMASKALFAALDFDLFTHIDRGADGGFKWSSQHLDGSCDEHSKTALGSFWAGALVLTRSTAGGRARGAAAILGSDCGGHGE